MRVLTTLAPVLAGERVRTAPVSVFVRMRVLSDMRVSRACACSLLETEGHVQQEGKSRTAVDGHDDVAARARVWRGKVSRLVHAAARTRQAAHQQHQHTGKTDPTARRASVAATPPWRKPVTQTSLPGVICHVAHGACE